MAILLRCPKCTFQGKLGTKTCKCGNNLKRNARYKVVVKLPSGKFLTKTVDDIVEAQRMEMELTRQAQNPAPALSLDNEAGPLPPQPIAPPPVSLPDPSPPAAPDCPLVSEVWGRYVDWAEGHKASWKDDKGRWLQHCQETFDGKRMNEVMPTDIDRIVSAMQKSKTRRGNDYAPATIRQVIILIKRVFNWAKGRKLYAGENPADVIEVPDVDNEITNYLREYQLESLLHVCEDWPNRRAAFAVLFALYTGKRQGEVLGLKWKDIDFKAATVRIVATNRKKKTTGVFPANEPALDILRQAQKIAVKDSPYVFCTENGRFYAGFDCIWRRIKRKAGLPAGFRFHDLRHTFATYLANSGEVDLFLLQNLLGHKDAKMTQRYSHILNKSLRRGAEIAGRVFVIKRRKGSVDPLPE